MNTAGRQTTPCGCPEEALIRSHVEGCPWFTAFVEAGRQTTPHTPSCHWYEQAEDGAESCDCGAASREATERDLHMECLSHHPEGTPCPGREATPDDGWGEPCPNCKETFPVLHGPHPTWVPCEGRETTGEAQIIKALHYLIGKAHLLQAGVDTLTEQEYALLEDVARWYDEQRGVTTDV